MGCPAACSGDGGWVGPLRSSSFEAGGGGQAGTWAWCWGELGEGFIIEKEEAEDIL